MAYVQQQAAMESDDREGLIIDYLEKLLPDEWDKMDLYQRRSFLGEDEFGTGNKKGTVRRERVCVMEIWCECFGKDKSDFQHKNSFEISAIMARIDGWEKTGKTMWLPIYGKQRVYRRKSETSSLKQTMERSTEQTI
jgi:hypothetical protein